MKKLRKNLLHLIHQKDSYPVLFIFFTITEKLIYNILIKKRKCIANQLEKLLMISKSSSMKLIILGEYFEHFNYWFQKGKFNKHINIKQRASN